MPARGWKDILVRTQAEIKADNLSLVAGGVAYYAFLATAPALAATLAIYALVSNPATVADHLQLLQGVVPPDVMPLLQEQVTQFVADDTKAGWSLAIGIAIALFGATRAARGLILGLNIAYDEAERRNVIKLNLLALGLTVTGIVAVVVLLAMVAGAPLALRRLALPGDTAAWLNWGRWPLLYLGFATALSVVYWIGPSRRQPKWQWVTWGALFAALLWLAASAGFSIYVSHFGNYGKSYGALASVVVFLVWLYLTAYVVLFGAELNAEMEHQTAIDTTCGAPKPMGRRGAYVADTVGATAEEIRQRKHPKATLEPGAEREESTHPPKRSE